MRVIKNQLFLKKFPPKVNKVIIVIIIKKISTTECNLTDTAFTWLICECWSNPKGD